MSELYFVSNYQKKSEYTFETLIRTLEFLPEELFTQVQHPMCTNTTSPSSIAQIQ